MKLLPLALTALTAATMAVAAPAPEAQAGTRCDYLSRAYSANDDVIRALDLGATHPTVQQQFTIRDEARGLGCPVGSDTLEAEMANGGISATVHNPLGQRQAAQSALCAKWEKAAHIGAVNGKPHFGFRIFVEPGDRLTAIERKSETTCLKVVKGNVTRVTSVKDGNLYQGNTMVGILSTKAYRLWGNDRSFHNAWTAGAGRRFYN